MCHFIVRSSPHIPLRHLMAASLVGLLFIGLAPSPSMPPVVEARPRCCRCKKPRRRR